MLQQHVAAGLTACEQRFAYVVFVVASWNNVDKLLHVLWKLEEHRITQRKPCIVNMANGNWKLLKIRREKRPQDGYEW